MKSEDIESLTSIRARLIKEFSRCKDYKYDKNALMKEYDHAKVLNETIKKIDELLGKYVKFS